MADRRVFIRISSALAEQLKKSWLNFDEMYDVNKLHTDQRRVY